MPEKNERTIWVVRRLSDGSFHFGENRDPRTCDLDGAELWTTPSGQLYCDEVHTKPAGAVAPFRQDHSTKPYELTIDEWKEIVALPLVRECWGLNDDVTPEEFSEMAYGVRFDFVSGSPGYIGDLYVLCGDAIGEPLTLIRSGDHLEAV